MVVCKAFRSSKYLMFRRDFKVFNKMFVTTNKIQITNIENIWFAYNVKTCFMTHYTTQHLDRRTNGCLVEMEF